MENINNPNPDLLATEQLEVDEESGAHLKDAGVWAKAIAIIASIIGGLAVVGLLLLGASAGSGGLYSLGDYIGIIFIIALLILGIALIGIINLFKFSNGMATGITSQDAAAFEKGITGLKYYFIFIGVLTLLLTLATLVQLIK